MERQEVSSTDTARPPDRLGRYELIATLGQGGMGTVYLGVAGGLGSFRKLLVLKELRRDLSDDDKFIEMFFAEARLAAKLNHPNIVHTIEAGREGERYFLAMEFLDGQTFRALIQRSAHPPRIGLALRIQILCEALAGLHYAHELCDYGGKHLEIVHRDVSPQNVFVTYDGQVKLIDFGIAQAADDPSSTDPGVFKGRFGYASPEHAKGEPVDRRSDVFSAGVMLWEAVTLKRFAKGPATKESIAARIAGSEPRLASVEPKVDPMLAAICDRALQVEPEARYSSAEELREALQQYLATKSETPKPSLIGRTVRVKFANERGEMHQLISANLQQSALSETMIRALSPGGHGDSDSGSRGWSVPPPIFGDSLSQDDPTTAADLSKLVSDTLPGRSASAWSSSRRERMLALSIFTAISLTLLLLFLSSRGAEPVASAPSPRSTPSEPPPLRPLSASEAHAAPQPLAAPAEPASPIEPATEQEKAPASAAARALRPRRTRSHAQTEMTVAPLAATAKRTLAPPAGVQPAEPPRPNDPGSMLGTDLRTLTKRVRSIDTEDPF